jgi:D-alanyl-D-alanine carboxypeptidase/D-alanyl-D-alanine-endopeptidase (penicillin-binding protein 4)
MKTRPVLATRTRIQLRAALVAAAVVLAAAPLAAAQSLSRRIDRIVASGDIGGAKLGVHVREVGASAPLVAIGAEEALIPASNMKLLTTGAALAVLGPDFVFRTEIAIDGDTVIVRGSGDPALADPEVLRNTEPRMTVEDFLNTLAGAVADKLDGHCSQIIIDDRVFDREFVHPSWDPNDLNKWYAPEVSGLNFHGNLLAVFASPAPEGAGAPPRLVLQPQCAWIEIANKAKTVQGSGSNTYWPARSPTANTFTLFGDVRTTAPTPLNTPTHNNPLLFGQLLAERLMKRGVSVGDEARPGLRPPTAVRVAEQDESLPAGKLVAVVTTPLQEVLNRCNTDSINLYAEALLKRIGHQVTREQGTWANGASVMRMAIEERLGADAAISTIISDGSGLSHANLVRPSTLTAWVESFATDDDLRMPYLTSMATPGRGTFARRFHGVDLDNQISGKSGVLTGVRTLSGIVQSDSGREVVFSVMLNDVPAAKGPNASKLAERIVTEIDAWLSEVSPSPQFGG